MQITIIQVGKTKSKYVREAENEYLKRLVPYMRVTQITIKEHILPSGDFSAGVKIVKTKEAQGIISKIPPKSLTIALDQNGKQYTSPEFARFIEQNAQTNPHLTFIIGGCYGLDETILNRAHHKISFSRLTYTHEIIRILLLEQLYRAFTIIRGKTYHY